MIRVITLCALVGISLGVHRFFANYDKEVIGATLFILLFSFGLMFYYHSLFHNKRLPRLEFLISVLFVFFMTIIMFAIIYAEPIEDSENYFLENGKVSNLTLADGMYFSTTTITTLGMGDIEPVGVFRYFVMSEVILGLMYTGLLIYFITKVMDTA